MDKTFVKIGGRLVNLSRVLFVDGGQWNLKTWRLAFHLDNTTTLDIDFDNAVEFNLNLSKFEDLVTIKL